MIRCSRSRQIDTTWRLRATLDAHVANLGYALLLKQIRPDIQNATEADIQAAASSTIPNVPVLFWSFRFMVAFGFWFIALFATAFWLSARQRLIGIAGSCGPPSSLCRCPGSLPNWAGLSPNMAANLG